MTTYTLNQVIETLAPVIAQKNDYRAIIDYTNGDTVLIDFSSCGEPFLFNNMIAAWSYQRNTFDENGEYTGTDELDGGVFCDSTYVDVFNFVLSLLNEKGYEVKDFYKESF